MAGTSPRHIQANPSRLLRLQAGRPNKATYEKPGMGRDAETKAFVDADCCSWIPAIPVSCACPASGFLMGITASQMMPITLSASRTIAITDPVDGSMDLRAAIIPHISLI